MRDTSVSAIVTDTGLMYIIASMSFRDDTQVTSFKIRQKTYYVDDIYYFLFSDLRE